MSKNYAKDGKYLVITEDIQAIEKIGYNELKAMIKQYEEVIVNKEKKLGELRKYLEEADKIGFMEEGILL